MHARRAEAAYHVELRAHVTGPEPEEALTALGAWLGQWTTTGGVPWRRWKVIRPKAEWGFHAALANHDLRRFSSRKAPPERFRHGARAPAQHTRGRLTIPNAPTRERPAGSRGQNSSCVLRPLPPAPAPMRGSW